jgi:branched-chain amino acid transport system ATP-binding protein
VTPTLLSIDRLRAGYGDITALRDVSLEVPAGEIVVVLGPNGAGKTTLLSAVAGLLAVMGGEITYDGRALGRDAAFKRSRAGIAFVQENKRVFKRMTVADNLFVATQKLAAKEYAARLDDVLQLFPALGEKLGRRAGELSGGQQQMLAIGQAMMSRPSVLLLDEPSAGLAPKLTAEVMDTVAAIAKRGLGVLLVEQAIHQALRVATSAYTLNLGVCTPQPDFATPRGRAALERVYLGGRAAQIGASADPPTMEEST